MVQQTCAYFCPGLSAKFLQFIQFTFKIRAFCRYTTVKSENWCSLNRLSNNHSSKILQSIPYKSTLITMLINSRLFATDNRLPV